MSRTFEFPLHRPAEEVRREAFRLLAEHRLDHTPTADGATFRGQGLAGSFRLTATHAFLTVTEKPFFLPWSVVQSRLQSYFA